MKKGLLTLFFALLTLASWAYDVKVDGIYYNLNKQAKTAEVTSGDSHYSGSVAIPEQITVDGATYSVTSIGESAFSCCSGLTSVTIPNSVTSIGYEAFNGCSGLASVTIGNSVTSIGISAFRDCSGLTSVTIPNSVTSIGSNAFLGCANVKELIYAEGTTNVIRTELTSITSVTIPNSVRSIGEYAFQNCSGLTSVTIPNSVTRIDAWAFGDCSGLTSVTIGNSVTSIGQSAFRDCSGLTSVTIPNSVTSIGGYAFSECTGLTSVTIPNSVTSIDGSAFYYCTGLTSVTIGNSVTSIGNRTFASCQNLEKVICHAENVPSTKTDAFENSYIEYVTLMVPDASIENYKAVDPWKKFYVIKGLSGNEPEVQVCEKPTITFENNHLKFATSTDGAEVVNKITCDDIKEVNSFDVELTATYNITAYATKAGYENSVVATATLVWLNASLDVDAINAPEIRVAARPVLVSGDNGVVTISGLADGEKVELYTTDGKLVNTTKAFGDTATCVAQKGAIIVKVGQQSIKVLVK